MLKPKFPGKTLLIAEAGNNHEGSFAAAKELVVAAKEAGADAIKFQTYRTELFQSRSADPARFERLAKFQLSHDQFAQLRKYATSLDLPFFSTPLDEESLKFLAQLCGVIKIASGDNNCLPFLRIAARQRVPLILSTGMLDLQGVRRAVHAIEEEWRSLQHIGELCVLHCVSAYPAPAKELNLSAIRLLRHTFECAIGYSDHALGIEAAVAAVALGATVIEKHFTIDKNRPGFRDHALSADPTEFGTMVARIRELEGMLGEERKDVQPSEAGVITAARRSLAARRDLASGSVLDEASVIWLRPGTGIPPGEEGRALGRQLTRPLAAGDLIPEGGG